MSDWDTVTVLKKKPLKAAQMKTESAINQARKFMTINLIINGQHDSLIFLFSYFLIRTTRT